MSLQKTVLDFSYELEDRIIGLVCHERDYRMAWHLNKNYGLRLKRQSDLEAFVQSGKSISTTYYLHKGEHNIIRLLRNKLLRSDLPKRSMLLPELPQYDYMLLIKNESEEPIFEQILECARNLQCVQLASEVSANQIKSQELLIFDDDYL